jgi:sialate O-acetylesterase
MRNGRAVWLAAAMLTATGALAEVKPNAMFADGCVLQQGMATPVYGTATKDGEKVTVKLGDQEVGTTAVGGKWLVKLKDLKAGGPFTLTVTGEANTVTLNDVLVGEVWVGSGQSNMDINAAWFFKGDAVLEGLANGGPYPQVRLAKRDGKGWTDSSPANCRNFSALCLSFGLRLQKELGVPVGLLVGAVGGTPSGFWLSQAAYDGDADCKAVAAKYAEHYDYDAAVKNYQTRLATWQKAADAAKAAGRREPPNKPQQPAHAGECYGKIGNLYEAHIRPFEPYGIRGVLWDQGESGTAVEGVDQFTLMGALIKGWRAEWGQGDFPWLYVQKPSGGGPAWDDADPVTIRASKPGPLPAAPPPAGGEYRALHLRIRQHPNTFLVIATDLGNGIHPVNKSGYGARACRVALGAVYGKPIEYYGPVFESAKLEGDKVRLTFSHVGAGLAAKGDKLTGFAICGADLRWHWADAAIDGATVVVSSAQVAKPLVVRYAWADNIPWANLFNKDGLPAQTFETKALAP